MELFFIFYFLQWYTILAVIYEQLDRMNGHECTPKWQIWRYSRDEEVEKNMFLATGTPGLQIVSPSLI